MSLKIKAEFQTQFRLIVDNIESFEKDLKKQISQAPQMFQFAPVILNPAPGLNITLIVDICLKLQLKPVLVIASDDLQLKQAEQLKIRTMTNDSVLKKTINKSSESVLSYKIISKPVRSGQQIYAEGSHLVVLKSVGAGAEVMADGDIHIYGELRGRAMAGGKGRKESRIICQTMNAELIAIAGNYIVREDMPEFNGAAQATLEQNDITFQKL